MNNALNKLIIQIPCLNEAGTLTQDVESVAPSRAGFRWRRNGRSSTTGTTAQPKVAADAGADHVISLGYNQGLALLPSLAGLEFALKQGAEMRDRKHRR